MEHLAERFGLSERRSCKLVSLNRATYFYEVKEPQKDDRIRARMREIAESHRRWGCPQIHRVLKREKLVKNHKKTERLYREEGLSIRRRKKKKKNADGTGLDRFRAPRGKWTDSDRFVRGISGRDDDRDGGLRRRRKKERAQPRDTIGLF